MHRPRPFSAIHWPLHRYRRVWVAIDEPIFLVCACEVIGKIPGRRKLPLSTHYINMIYDYKLPPLFITTTNREGIKHTKFWNNIELNNTNKITNNTRFIDLELNIEYIVEITNHYLHLLALLVTCRGRIRKAISTDISSKRSLLPSPNRRPGPSIWSSKWVDDDY